MRPFLIELGCLFCGPLINYVVALILDLWDHSLRCALLVLIIFHLFQLLSTELILIRAFLHCALYTFILFKVLFSFIDKHTYHPEHLWEDCEIVLYNSSTKTSFVTLIVQKCITYSSYDSQTRILDPCFYNYINISFILYWCSV